MRRGLNRSDSGSPQQGQKQEPKASRQVTLHVPRYMAEAADVISRAVAIEQSAVVRMLVSLGIRVCKNYDLLTWALNQGRESYGSTTSKIFVRIPDSMMNEIKNFADYADVKVSAAIRACYQCGLVSLNDYTLAEILDISIDSSNADDVKVRRTLQYYEKKHKKEVSIGIGHNYLQLVDALLVAEPQAEYITGSSKQLIKAQQQEPPQKEK